VSAASLAIIKTYDGTSVTAAHLAGSNTQTTHYEVLSGRGFPSAAQYNHK